MYHPWSSLTDGGLYDEETTVPAVACKRSECVCVHTDANVPTSRN